MLALGATPFEDHRMAFPDGKTPLMSLGAGDAAPLAFDLCPVVQHHDPQHGEITIGIVPGSMIYIAEKLGLVPDDPHVRPSRPWAASSGSLTVAGCSAAGLVAVARAGREPGRRERDDARRRVLWLVQWHRVILLQPRKSQARAGAARYGAGEADHHFRFRALDRRLALLARADKKHRRR